MSEGGWTVAGDKALGNVLVVDDDPMVLRAVTQAFRRDGQQRLVTTLFADVRGFTALSEKLPAEFVLQVLNEYFAAAVEIVEEAGGTVDKFIGDALLAVFGALDDLPDQAVRAVRAACAIQNSVVGLRARWVNRPWANLMDVSQFSVGIGINTGWVVAGNLGSPDRMEYAVIGDAVNLASRLCANARPSQILIGPQTAAEVRGSFRLSSLARLKVKGRQQPVLASEVVLEDDTSPPQIQPTPGKGRGAPSLHPSLAKPYVPPRFSPMKSNC